MSKSERTIPDAEAMEQFSKMFKALSNPHRLNIFLEFAKCFGEKDKFCGEADKVQNCQIQFAERLGLAPSTVSHHFKELKEAGLIKTERDGKDVLVWVNTEALDALRDLW